VPQTASKEELRMYQPQMCTYIEPEPLTVPEVIDQYAREYGLSVPIMKRIAYCESFFIPNAENNSSSATGLFQIIDGTWDYFGCQGERTNVEDNVVCAMKIATEGGLHHWNASASCWR